MNKWKYGYIKKLKKIDEQIKPDISVFKPHEFGYKLGHGHSIESLAFHTKDQHEFVRFKQNIKGQVIRLERFQYRDFADVVMGIRHWEKIEI